MPRLTVDDERRFREIAQIHQDLIERVMVVSIGWFNPDDFTKLDRAAHLLDAITVKGDAAREKRTATNGG